MSHDEELRIRPEDQPLPTPNDSPGIQDMVIADLRIPGWETEESEVLAKMVADRRELGIKRYRTPLQAHNGRDVLLDALEEAVDLTVYLKQATVEYPHNDGVQELYISTLSAAKMIVFIRRQYMAEEETSA